MKRAKLIAVAVLVALGPLMPILTTHTTAPTTWQTLEAQLPNTMQSAGFRTITMQTEASERVPLPLGLRVQRLMRPEPRSLVTGFPDSVRNYTLESVRSNARLHCLVRYSSGKVARTILQFPAAAKEEAAGLGEVLRRVFPNDTITLHETTDAKGDAANRRPARRAFGFPTPPQFGCLRSALRSAHHGPAAVAEPGSSAKE